MRSALSLFLAILLLFASCSLLPASQILAQESPVTTFTVTPALIDKTVTRSEQLDLSINLHNQSSTPQALSAYVKNFAAKNLEGEITFGDENISSYAAASWLKIDQPSLILSPDESQTIIAHLTVPNNAEPGGHYASILFEQVVQSALSQRSQVQTSARLAVLIFLTVKGKVVEAGQVLGATPGSQCSNVVCGFSAPKFLDKGPVPFAFIFNNTGNVHVRPKGTITISQSGHTLATLPIEDRAVLPSSQREFKATWNRLVLFGTYTAKLHLVYGTKNYQLDASTTFYAFPWQWVLAVSLFIIALIGFFILRKFYKIKRLHYKIRK